MNREEYQDFIFNKRLADEILILKNRIERLESEVERLKHPKGYELVNEHELTDK